jgi:hypothetical protein
MMSWMMVGVAGQPGRNEGMPGGWWLQVQLCSGWPEQRGVGYSRLPSVSESTMPWLIALWSVADR